jgi:hypothetical protein
VPETLIAACAETSLKVVPVEGGTQSAACVGVAGADLVIQTGHLPLGSATWSYGTAPYAYVPSQCALLDWTDGLSIGWAVALCFLLPAAVAFTKRGL